MTLDWALQMSIERREEISNELSRLVAQQTEYFKKDSPTPTEIRDFKQAGDRIRKLFAELQKREVA